MAAWRDMLWCKTAKGVLHCESDVGVVDRPVPYRGAWQITAQGREVWSRLASTLVIRVRRNIAQYVCLVTSVDLRWNTELQQAATIVRTHSEFSAWSLRTSK